jgi:chromosome partitioning protein
MRRIAFINEKGGTAKTTLAVNVAAYLAQTKGMSVLLVDLDTQGHAGKSLGLDVRTLTPNVFHWLTDEGVRLTDVARPTAVPNLQLVPAYKEMADFPLILAADPRRALRLSDRLQKEAAGYDLVVMDGPPSLGLTTTNILVAACEVVIPVALTYLALDGCAELAQTVEKVAKDQGRPELHVSRVVPTLYRKTALAEEIRSSLTRHFPGQVTEPLAINVKIDEAQSHGKTVFEYAPKSKGALMLAAIAEEIHAAGLPALTRAVGS